MATCAAVNRVLGFSGISIPFSFKHLTMRSVLTASSLASRCRRMFDTMTRIVSTLLLADDLIEFFCFFWGYVSLFDEYFWSYVAYTFLC